MTVDLSPQEPEMKRINFKSQNSQTTYKVLVGTLTNFSSKDHGQFEHQDRHKQDARLGILEEV